MKPEIILFTQLKLNWFKKLIQMFSKETQSLYSNRFNKKKYSHINIDQCIYTLLINYVKQKLKHARAHIWALLIINIVMVFMSFLNSQSVGRMDCQWRDGSQVSFKIFICDPGLISSTGIYAEIANNTSSESKLYISLWCKKSLGYYDHVPSRYLVNFLP